MLPIFKNEEKKTTTAVINDCAMDAIRHTQKKLDIRDYSVHVTPDDLVCGCCGEEVEAHIGGIPHLDELVLSDTYKATVTCDERDEYDAAVGEDEAVKKVMSNHNKGYKKALTRWQVAMLKDIMNVSPETFDAALQKVRPCKCKENK